jgi:hypothetical protein
MPMVYTPEVMTRSPLSLVTPHAPPTLASATVGYEHRQAL